MSTEKVFEFIRANFSVAIKLTLFSLFSILIRGYQYGSGNQVHYFNFAFHKFYPNLFLNDYLFKIHDLPYTIFVDFIYWLLKIFGENNFLIFLIYFDLLLVFYAAIYLITNFFFRNKRLSWLVLLLFIFPVPIGGSTISTLDKALTPRFVAETFLLWSTYFLLIKKYIKSAIVAGIGFLFHPITLIPYVFITILSKANWKLILTTISVFVLVSSPILIKFILQGQGGGLFIDEVWRNIIYDRLPYIFIERWSVINFFVLVAICVFLVAYKYIFTKKLNTLVKAISFVSLGIFIIAVISSLTSFRLGLQLQLGRNLYLLVVFTIIYGFGSFFTKFAENHFKKIAFVLIIASLVLCLPARHEYGILWINPLDEYQKAAVWAKDNTPENSIFLVPLDEFGFRFWSKRSVFLEQKEGGDSLYDRNFALEWNRREEIIESGRALNGKNQIDYFVTKGWTNAETVVYKNNKFRIYKI